MIPSIENMPAVYCGDRIPARNYQISVNGSPLDLTGVKIKCQFRIPDSDEQPVLTYSTEENTIQITDAVAGEFQFVKRTGLNIPAGVYEYDIQFTLANGDIVTYIKGEREFVKDVTR